MSFRTFYINNAHICYQEQLSSDPAFEKFYLIENPDQVDIIAVPDGCIDLECTWENNICRGYVCGSFLQGGVSLVGRYHRCFGMKLRSNVRFGFLHQDTKELMGRRIPLSMFLDSRPIEQRLSECGSFLEMTEAICKFFNDKQLLALPIIASSAAQMIAQAAGIQRISDVVSSMGYTQQYVNTIFRQNYGISLKKYSDIVRMQTALQYLEAAKMMDAVADLGYYDQAHFIHEFKRYTLITPKLFIDQVCRNKQCMIV